MTGVTRILFLDLDGTVRKGIAETGKHVNGPGDVDVFDGVVELIKAYKAKGWRVVSISNQGGIATGHVSENDCARAMQETARQCAMLFDGMLWCPHHPTAEGPENKCLCRKPRIGNVVRAFTNLAQAGVYSYPQACLFVGDLQDDQGCAANANIPFMWASDWRRQKPEDI